MTNPFQKWNRSIYYNLLGIISFYFCRVIDYYVLNILNLQDCYDRERSVIKTQQSIKVCIYEVNCYETLRESVKQNI